MKKGGGSGDRTTGNEANRGEMDKRRRLCSERRELRRAKEEVRVDTLITERMARGLYTCQCGQGESDSLHDSQVN